MVRNIFIWHLCYHMRYIRESTVAGRWHRISSLVYPHLVLFCGFCETLYLLNQFERLWHIDASLNGQWADKPEPFIFIIRWKDVFALLRRGFVTTNFLCKFCCYFVDNTSINTITLLALWVFALSLLSASARARNHRSVGSVLVLVCYYCCLTLNYEFKIVDYWLCKCIFTL